MAARGSGKKSNVKLKEEPAATGVGTRTNIAPKVRPIPRKVKKQTGKRSTPPLKLRINNGSFKGRFLKHCEGIWTRFSTLFK